MLNFSAPNVNRLRYPEMMYSAQLSREQVDDIYSMGAGAVDCTGVRNCSDGWRFIQVGAPAGGSLIFTHIPFGLAYGLLEVRCRTTSLTTTCMVTSSTRSIASSIASSGTNVLRSSGRLPRPFQ